MFIRYSLLAAIACLGIQQATAQVVQLPTIRTFGTQGTVLVPDQGGVHLGSVGRAAMGSVQRGVPFLPGSRSGIGMQSSRVGATAHATIIDLQAMDEQIRGMPSPPPRRSVYNSRRPDSFDAAMRLHQQHSQRASFGAPAKIW